jgi:hypothetical protein
MWFLPRILLLLLLNIRFGFAGECPLDAPPYKLASDAVVWSMTIGKGQNCIRGLRSWHTLIDQVQLVTPPQSGQVTLQGPSFLYRAASEFHGADSFTLMVSGRLDRIAGSSTIQVMVFVK